MTKEEKEKLKLEYYNVYLDKCLKKTKMDIIRNPSGFVRGIPKELANDMYILALNNFERIDNKNTLERLKYICEYFLSKRSKARISLESNTNSFIYDKFSVYAEQLEKIKDLLLKNNF